MELHWCKTGVWDIKSELILAANQKHLGCSYDTFFKIAIVCSVLHESGDADLYVTYSGSEEHVGIHKFGKNRVGPVFHNKGINMEMDWCSVET